MSVDPDRREGPTEVVETEDGELVERLSGGTATLLLVWLIGVGAFSTLLGMWLFVWIVSGERMGIGSLFSGFGFYTALAGATGPCVLWLSGRAQGHSLRWFVLAAVKIALLMAALVVAVVLVGTLVLAGRLPAPGAIGAAGLFAIVAVVLATLWAIATWSADRWIARARLVEDSPPPTR